MEDDGFFTASHFAKIARTTKATLHHYDAIGLLSHSLRDENNKYRYYSIGQLADINMIHTLQAFDIPLSEIRKLKEKLKDVHTAEQFEELHAQWLDKIDRKINEWVRSQKLLFALRKAAHSVVNVNEDAVTIQFQQAEAIILGDLNDCSNGRNDYHALSDFYDALGKKFPDLDLKYPVWGTFSEERIKRGDWVWPDRYYFYNPDGHDKKPAALYAIGYTRGGYGHSDELYKRMIDFINKNGFEICGDAYEEYPLNEICVSDGTNYLIRVMLTVREKKRNGRQRK